MIRLWVKGTTPPDDYWQEILQGQHSRSCDGCQADISDGADNHLRCPQCENYDICLSCLLNPEVSLKHKGCPENVSWNLWNPLGIDDDWVQNQKAHIEAFNAEVEAEAERQREQQAVEAAAAAAAAESARREKERQQAAAAKRKPLPNTSVPKITTTKSAPIVQGTNAPRKSTTSNTQFLAARKPNLTTRAPSPSPRSGLAPPKPQQAQRRKSSAGLNSFLKGALQVTNAVLQAENRALRAQNGGGFGGGASFNNNNTFVDTSGGGGFDMSSFWAPINSAAGDPIQ
ncbi:hypothetical protein LTR10_011728 [Elasticomyces elasticus]|uniref:ZZ-type domain-containing protein n=1 Tax=Exophiala sideris TaxID=1016849 RepID=A0ABR0JDW4_9EURO|nr:hypothetical protein LTR10_011728 [Elasticomyces elasticus]KAK5031813.1 hypothetical protein LTS07_004434 [Exophiala sideris]KAK5040742.1 hypothetical protein LTR13_003043 [Exophiala sideris]KAK5061923.1 hypothetical protein LTR69_005107 [Exophiala sideris]KAK5184623.1 hypothetical protein LTR44_003298 [Eurotiomycetes sp. CCFEE 6388]